MTTFESTVELLRRLPEEDLFHPLPEKVFFDRLAVARKHAQEGELRPASTVISELREKLEVNPVQKG